MFYPEEAESLGTTYDVWSNMSPKARKNAAHVTLNRNNTVSGSYYGPTKLPIALGLAVGAAIFVKTTARGV